MDKKRTVPSLLLSSPKYVLDYVTSLKVIKITKHSSEAGRPKKVGRPSNDSKIIQDKIAFPPPPPEWKEPRRVNTGTLTEEECKTLVIAKQLAKVRGPNRVRLTTEQKRVITKERNRIARELMKDKKLAEEKPHE